MQIGILALQGAVKPHFEIFSALGIQTLLVRTAQTLSEVDGIVLPGGESSAMIHLLKLNQLWTPLQDYVRTKPTWGICAGSILLARSVSSPAQESLNVLDIQIQRNAYGRQLESFIDKIQPTESAQNKMPEESEWEGVFIRAPQIHEIASNVEVLCYHKELPVAVECKNIIATTFHPELTSSNHWHRYFIELCLGAN